MDRIIITRPVVVKIRVTEGYKKAYAAQADYSVRLLNSDLKRLEAEERKIGEGPGTDPKSLEQLRLERHKRLEAREKLVEQAQKLLGLAPGTEIVHGRVESIVEARVGDMWRQVMEVEIVLEDGQIAEIRQGTPGDGSSG
ncbi:MAG: hypothetical protein C4575_12185 [Desulforudis sp.]|nr:MAG: hypothetical protein C4575_12185 [Desulforudis sp.]